MTRTTSAVVVYDIPLRTITRVKTKVQHSRMRTWYGIAVFSSTRSRIEQERCQATAGRMLCTVATPIIYTWPGQRIARHVQCPVSTIFHRPSIIGAIPRHSASQLQLRFALDYHYSCTTPPSPPSPPHASLRTCVVSSYTLSLF